MRNVGYHMFGTLCDCDNEKLFNREGMENLLKIMPGKIGMNIIPIPNNPTLYECLHPVKPQSSGYTGGVYLWESHFNIHTWDGEVDFDLFSCNWFEHEKALEILMENFGGRLRAFSFVDRNTCRPAS